MSGDVQTIWTSIMAAVAAFVSDGRVVTIVGLIILDVLLGIAAAIRLGSFEWRRLGQFYQTMVLPYVLGYLAFYVFSLVAIPELLGEFGYLAGEAMLWLAWIALVACLGGSVVGNARALGYQINGPDDDEG